MPKLVLAMFYHDDPVTDLGQVISTTPYARERDRIDWFVVSAYPLGPLEYPESNRAMSLHTSQIPF